MKVDIPFLLSLFCLVIVLLDFEEDAVIQSNDKKKNKNERCL